MTRPLSDLAAAEGLGFVETFGNPAVVEVYDGPAPMLKPGGPLLVRVIAWPGEHPADLLRRALATAWRERVRRNDT